jgi:hypothetical protein
MLDTVEQTLVDLRDQLTVRRIFVAINGHPSKTITLRRVSIDMGEHSIFKIEKNKLSMFFSVRTKWLLLKRVSIVTIVSNYNRKRLISGFYLKFLQTVLLYRAFTMNIKTTPKRKTEKFILISAFTLLGMILTGIDINVNYCECMLISFDFRRILSTWTQ